MSNEFYKSRTYNLFRKNTPKYPENKWCVITFCGEPDLNSGEDLKYHILQLLERLKIDPEILNINFDFFFPNSGLGPGSYYGCSIKLTQILGQLSAAIKNSVLNIPSKILAEFDLPPQICDICGAPGNYYNTVYDKVIENGKELYCEPIKRQILCDKHLSHVLNDNIQEFISLPQLINYFSAINEQPPFTEWRIEKTKLLCANFVRGLERKNTTPVY